MAGLASLQLERNENADESRLLWLNDDCILEIFKLLELDDCVNLAETYIGMRYVADFLFKYKKFSEFKIDAEMIDNGDAFIDRIFDHIGQHLSSLTIDFSDINGRSAQNVLFAVTRNCHQLKKLEINNWHEDEKQTFSDVTDLHNVEMLSFYDCGDLSLVNEFFKSFKNVEYLNICGCNTSNDLLYAVFANNPNIKSFLCSGYGQSVDFKLLNLATKLERLCVTIDKQANILQPMPFALNALTKLNLTYDGNCNNLLNRLAEIGIMEELDLLTEVNDSTINIVKSFTKLHSLVLEATNNNFRLTSSLVWPPNIKHLKVLHFLVPYNGFMSIIGQLRKLEKIDLYGCKMLNDNNIITFNDVRQLSRNIESMMSSTNSKRKLDIILPDESALYSNADRLEKYVINSPYLRILNDTDNEFEEHRIGDIIYFPGFD